MNPQDTKNKVEYIVCAAIWYHELPAAAHAPFNIPKGLVICGHRHAHCISIMNALTGKKHGDFEKQPVQGFITNQNEFVNRYSAMKIAKAANQILPESQNSSSQLFSEDIY